MILYDVILSFDNFDNNNYSPVIFLLSRCQNRITNITKIALLASEIVCHLPGNIHNNCIFVAETGLQPQFFLLFQLCCCHCNLYINL